MTSTTKLICPECQRENEPERIYCHECGAKLDRTAVIAAKPADSRAKEQRRVRNMFDPHRAKMRLLFFRISKLILGALLAAVVIQMLLPPEVPPEKKLTELTQLGLDLENAVNYHRPTPLQYTEDQVNDYLVQIARSKQKALSKPLLDFKRIIVEFTEGKCTITAERSVLGYYSVYTSETFTVQVTEGAINASSKGGAIGRLPIYPQVMPYLDIVFADVWPALDRERKLLAKTSAIEFHDKSVVLQAAAPQ
jgi:hypothetical protein